MSKHLLYPVTGAINSKPYTPETIMKKNIKIIVSPTIKPDDCWVAEVEGKPETKTDRQTSVAGAIGAVVRNNKDLFGVEIEVEK